MTIRREFQELTPEQGADYDRNGFNVVEDFVAPEVCRTLIDHFMSVHSGQKPVEWYTPRDPKGKLEV